MAKRAGKPKAFAMPQACLLLAVFLFEPVSAAAETAVDGPVFRMAGRWTMPSLPAVSRPALPSRDAMNADDRTAVETILLEAAGDGFASMIAVGEAIRNRTSLFRRSASEVCLQPKQFSGWNDRERAAVFLKRHRAYYGRAWLAWKLSGATSLTGGATDYHTTDILPYWASAYTPSAQIGSHTFYIRQAGAAGIKRPVPA